MIKIDNLKIAVLGLGYVGLPLSLAFSKVWPTVGFDLSIERVNELNRGLDSTSEVSPEELKSAKNLLFSTDAEKISNCNVFVITVPTPIDINKRPNISALKLASKCVGRYIQRDSVVIYESTVYPGATEEDCVPILEAVSGLIFNKDFFVGYSPERINPGDKDRRLADICKVTSGSTPASAILVDSIYKKIISEGTHLAPSIRVAEAAKVIENTQRDLNIALMNELAIICSSLDINTLDVLEAARTKWNFLDFRPGLVGGHCIGVDPYYLTHKAESKGYHPDVILAGRRLNDGMGVHVANRFVREMIKTGNQIKDARILVMGLTFKENCSDLRNSKVIDVISELQFLGAKVEVYDPLADPEEANKMYSIKLCDPTINSYNGIILCVGHKEISNLGIKKIQSFGCADVIIFDLKGILRGKSKASSVNILEL